MFKFNLLFALLLGTVVAFTSCSDDELTPEEIEAKEKQELIDKAANTLEEIGSKKWKLEDYQASEKLVAAANEGHTQAFTRVGNLRHIKGLDFTLTFTAVGDSLKPVVTTDLTTEQITEKQWAHQNDLYAAYGQLDFLLISQEAFLSDLKRIIVAPFAADDLKAIEIIDESKAECIFKIGARDFSEMSYEDVVLSSRKLIGENDDKIYFNEDGTLTVETTSVDFGVSKLILKEVK